MGTKVFTLSTRSNNFNRMNKEEIIKIIDSLKESEDGIFSDVKFGHVRGWNAALEYLKHKLCNCCPDDGVSKRKAGSGVCLRKNMGVMDESKIDPYLNE